MFIKLKEKNLADIIETVKIESKEQTGDIFLSFLK